MMHRDAYKEVFATQMRLARVCVAHFLYIALQREQVNIWELLKRQSLLMII